MPKKQIFQQTCFRLFPKKKEKHFVHALSLWIIQNANKWKHKFVLYDSILQMFLYKIQLTSASSSIWELRFLKYLQLKKLSPEDYTICCTLVSKYLRIHQSFQRDFFLNYRTLNFWKHGRFTFRWLTLWASRIWSLYCSRWYILSSSFKA